MVQWQQVLVYQYLALLTVTTYMLLESELAFVRLEGSQALFGVLVVIERVRCCCCCSMCIAVSFPHTTAAFAHFLTGHSAMDDWRATYCVDMAVCARRHGRLLLQHAYLCHGRRCHARHAAALV